MNHFLVDLWGTYHPVYFADITDREIARLNFELKRMTKERDYWKDRAIEYAKPPEVAA